jgi:Raf kinase inhibitor-like YbhB/YbcL family protein
MGGMAGRLSFVLAAVLMVIAPLGAQQKEGKPMDLSVRSGAFNPGGMIPSKYTCDGSDVSPPISWSKGPEGTMSYALVADDPDAPAGTWVHWVLCNVPAGKTSLAENIAKMKKLDDGSLQGMNDFRKIGYGGPCPPGGTHRYFFKVYALNATLKVEPGLTKKQLLKEMEGHVLAQGELMGKYSR